MLISLSFSPLFAATLFRSSFASQLAQNPKKSNPEPDPKQDVTNGVRVSQLYNARGKKLAVAAVQRKESNGSEVSNSAAAAGTEKAAKRKSLIGTPKIPDSKHSKQQQNPGTAKSENSRRRSSVSAPSAKSYANVVKGWVRQSSLSLGLDCIPWISSNLTAFETEFWKNLSESDKNIIPNPSNLTKTL